MKMKSMKGEDLIKQIKEFCIEHGRLHEVGRHFPAVTFDALSEFFEGKILVDEKELREILED